MEKLTEGTTRDVITTAQDWVKTRRYESKIQADCVKWFKNDFVKSLEHLEAEQQKALRMLFHGNQNEMPRFQNIKLSKNAREAINGWFSKVKAMGLTAGVADTSLKCRVASEGVVYGFVEIEFKTPKGRQSPRQKAYQKSVELAGGLYKVIRSEKEFKQFMHGLIIIM